MTDDKRDTTIRRGPVVIEDDALPLAATTPADAPSVDEAVADLSPEPATAAAVRIAGSGRSWGLGALFWASLGGLLSLAVGLWFWETVEGLIARNVWLGRAALALALIAAVTFVAMSLRELAALSRLRKADGVREDAARAYRSADRGAAAGAKRNQ